MVYPPLKTDYVLIDCYTKWHHLHKVTRYASDFSNWSATYHVMSTGREKS